MQTIKTNQLTPGTKKTLKERLLSSIFIAIFFIVLFVLGILADDVNNWSPLNQLGREICMWILLIYLLPIIFISCYEIKNVFFKNKIIPYFFILLNVLMLVYAPTLVYLLKYYYWASNSNILPFATNINTINSITNIFAIVLASAIFITVIINTCLLWAIRNITFKNWLILNLIVGLTAGFFIGTYFFLFVRGWLSLLWLMLIVFGSDSFAYFGGILFGKHQMAKNISPKKTWEGFAIGQVITVVLALLILFGFSKIPHTPNVANQIMGIQFEHYPISFENNIFFKYPVVWWIVMVFITIILSVSSVLGDLMFSLFKRKFNIKDYGSLIPGHGGILDRIDSHSVVISLYFILSFFIALFANTIVFFPILA